MAILDETLEFCDSTDVSSTAGTNLEGDVVDLVSGQELGDGFQMYLVIVVETAFASGASATVQFQLASDAAAAIATDGSATVHWASQVFGYASLTAGKQIIVPLPQGFPDAERYLGLLVVTGAATTTAGTISAYLTTQVPHNWRAYPDGNN